MSFSTLIARRFLSKGQGFSSSLVKIATISIALGVLVMTLSVAILRGFQSEIKQKVVGFGSHIVVKNQFVGNGYEVVPISSNREVVERLKSLPEVKSFQMYAQKGGMLKTDDQIHGIIFKGLSANYDSTFFASNMVDGRLFRHGQVDDSGAIKPGNEVIISRLIASKLHLKVGDKAKTYFWQGSNYRARAFEVVGIYNTDLSDFDEHYIIGDLAQVQRLNDWDDTLVEGYEIMVNDFDHLEEMAHRVAEQCDYDLIVSQIEQDNPALFSWLELLNSNIALILIVMAVVCCVAVISALLIMIFEKTSMIGLLKTLGADNPTIRRIFLIKSAEIIGWGLLIGNILSLIICFIQSKFHILRLDAESYYMPYVPIDINPFYFLLISAGTLIVCLLALLIPATAISRIEPAKTMRVE